MNEVRETVPGSVPAPRGLKKLLFYLIPLLVLFLFLEAFLTIADPWLFAKGFWQYDPDFGFRVRPGAMDSNSFGFNDTEHALTKKRGTYRIEIVSDSYNWIGGLQHNYTHVLQGMFDKAYGPGKVEVINVGYPMTHTAEELGIVRKYGLQYHPDLLVLGFFTGNDFFDGDPYRKRIVVNGTYFDIDPRHELRLFGRPILLQSRMWMLAKQAWETWHSVDHSAKSDSFTPEVYSMICAAHLTFFDRHKLAHGDLDKNIHYILGALDQMVDLMAENHIPFKVAIYPAEEQVYQDLFRQVCAEHKMNPDDYDLEQLGRLVQQTCDHRHVPTLDMLPAFRAHSKNAVLYIPRNTHWSNAGNDLAAQLEFDWLKPDVDRFFATPGPQ